MRIISIASAIILPVLASVSASADWVFEALALPVRRYIRGWLFGGVAGLPLSGAAPSSIAAAGAMLCSGSSRAGLRLRSMAVSRVKTARMRVLCRLG